MLIVVEGLRREWYIEALTSRLTVFGLIFVLVRVPVLVTVVVLVNAMLRGY